MLKTPMNEWILKAVQIETALMALGEIDLPPDVGVLRTEAEEKVRTLLRAWNGRRPLEQVREWKQETQEAGKPRDTELSEVVAELKREGQGYTLHRLTGGGETVETLVAGARAWMAAGGEYYYGHWDAEEQVLEVGRDDETGEPGSGLVLKLTGELVAPSSLEG
ncbi:hypothetical protein [Hyalangium rubrum]|uniref:Phage protein n=1 Tax=Hyalangium rubrum TaxID=3103134 RepID=A0ABU5GZF3_9BACT|nr:hypothetical protein [Hyalangium sp. s54d21]MDY7226079.1 hypothetical protein [Hyalangium sp. s54d21]